MKATLSRIDALKRSAKLFFLATFIDGAFYSGWILFFNLYIIEAGFDYQFLGLINAVPVVSALVFGIPMGMLSDKIGRKPAMLTGFLIASTAMVLMVLNPEPKFMLIMAAIWGGTGQLYGLSRTPFMMEVSNKANRNMVFSIGFALFPLASFFGNAMFGQFPQFFNNLFNFGDGNLTAYKIVLISAVALSCLAMIPIAMIKKPDQVKGGDSQVKAKRESIWPVIKNPITLKLALPELTISLGASLIVPYFNVFFSSEHGLESEELGWIFSILSLLTGIACLLAPRYSRKAGGTVNFYILTLIVSIICFSLIGFSPITWLVILLFLIRGPITNMAIPLFDAFAMEKVSEKNQGLVNSVRLWAINVGWAIGVYVSGIVQENVGFAPLFVATVVLHIVTIFLIRIFFSKPKSQESSDNLV